MKNNILVSSLISSTHSCFLGQKKWKFVHECRFKLTKNFWIFWDLTFFKFISTLINFQKPPRNFWSSFRKTHFKLWTIFGQFNLMCGDFGAQRHSQLTIFQLPSSAQPSVESSNLGIKPAKLGMTRFIPQLFQNFWGYFWFLIT